MSTLLHKEGHWEIFKLNAGHVVWTHHHPEHDNNEWLSRFEYPYDWYTTREKCVWCREWLPKEFMLIYKLLSMGSR